MFCLNNCDTATAPTSDTMSRTTASATKTLRTATINMRDLCQVRCLTKLKRLKRNGKSGVSYFWSEKQLAWISHIHPTLTGLTCLVLARKENSGDHKQAKHGVSKGRGPAFGHNASGFGMESQPRDGTPPHRAFRDSKNMRPDTWPRAVQIIAPAFQPRSNSASSHPARFMRRCTCHS